MGWRSELSSTEVRCLTARLVIAAVLAASTTAHVIVSGQESQAPERMLDVGVYNRAPDPGPSKPYPPKMPGFSGKDREEIAVTLVLPDKENFELGNPFLYELWIRNDGREAIRLPWSPDVHLFMQPQPDVTPRGYRRGVVQLEVSGGAELAETVVRFKPLGLFGTDDVPGSLLSLSPGESARIRVPANWSDLSREEILKLRQVPGGNVQVEAVLILTDVPLGYRTEKLQIGLSQSGNLSVLQ